MIIHHQFTPLLQDYELEDLDAAHGAICGLWPTLELAFVNRAWGQFAQDNGGAGVVDRFPLGSAILLSTPAPLRAFYRNAYSATLATGQPWNHDYECSTPTMRRMFRMRALPLRDGAGLMVLHVLNREEPHPGVVHAANDEEYLNVNGVIMQCAHCRTVRHARLNTRWDWVPAYVVHPPRNVSHGLCPTCFGYYFPNG